MRIAILAVIGCLLAPPCLAQSQIIPHATERPPAWPYQSVVPDNNGACTIIKGTTLYTNITNMQEMAGLLWGDQGAYQNAPIFIARVKLVSGQAVQNTYLIALSGLQEDRNGANQSTSPESILEISLGQMDQYTQSVLRAISELRIPTNATFLVVGHSLGGMVAQILWDGMLPNISVVTLGAPILQVRNSRKLPYDPTLHHFWIGPPASLISDPIVLLAPVFFPDRYAEPTLPYNAVAVDDGGTNDPHSGFPKSRDLAHYGVFGTTEPNDVTGEPEDVTLDSTFEYRCPASVTPKPLDSACNVEFANGRSPAVSQAQIGAAAQLTPICYWGFAVLHSGLAREPLYAAEYLTPARIDLAGKVQRGNRFHIEPRVPADQRSELEDYVVPYRGFGDFPPETLPLDRPGRAAVDDRGHMAPAADMPNPKSDDDSFSLANIVPQAPAHNTGLWRQVEIAVRRYAAARDVYVVTGPIFRGPAIAALNGRVWVPWEFYKAVYDPKTKAAVAIVSRNASGRICRLETIDELTRDLSGTDVFPGIDAHAHANLLPIPSLPEVCL
jgi:endonuclease G